MFPLFLETCFRQLIKQKQSNCASKFLHHLIGAFHRVENDFPQSIHHLELSQYWWLKEKSVQGQRSQTDDNEVNIFIENSKIKPMLSEVSFILKACSKYLFFRLL